jgi:HlyD family secretion protein
VVEEGRARLRLVEIGRRNGLSAQVLDGLNEGDQVIAHPSEQIADGIRVEPRQ